MKHPQPLSYTYIFMYLGHIIPIPDNIIATKYVMVEKFLEGTALKGRVEQNAFLKMAFLM